MEARVDIHVHGATERDPLAWIALLRVAAALAVVVLHVSAAGVVTLPPGSSEWWAANAYDSFTRWSVPIFVLMSGALLLDVRHATSALRFCSRRIGRLLPLLAFWSALYFAWHASRGQPLTLSSAAAALLTGTPEYHMWFLFMSLGLALVVPLGWLLIQRVSRRGCMLVALAAMALASSHSLAVALGWAPAPRTIFTMWLPYVGYLWLGYVLQDRIWSRISTRVLVAACAGSLACIACGTALLMPHFGWLPPGLYFYEFLSLPVVVLSCSLFLLGARFADQIDASLHRWREALHSIARVTPGIYLIHPLILVVFADFGFHVDPFGQLAGIPLVAGSAFIVACLASGLTSRVPLLRAIVT